ncbi:hypothetical protein H9W90_11965 [Polaribacter pectinis]|uniref:Uncharacterized protein n=1 Tax=Polaribacter pectinis TaxID=2738844 RepID=A0A7G9L8F3_9FLAO|nr:hypothetical protein [Polaribacter pectinis]QNM84902.1 hypothetical protein H9W90_11965 [Polaribacter pectinis]
MTRLIPIELRKESLEKFKTIFFEKYNYQLSDEQAKEQGLKLMRLMVVLLENIEIGLGRGSNNMIE